MAAIPLFWYTNIWRHNFIRTDGSRTIPRENRDIPVPRLSDIRTKRPTATITTGARCSRIDASIAKIELAHRQRASNFRVIASQCLTVILVLQSLVHYTDYCRMRRTLNVIQLLLVKQFLLVFDLFIYFSSVLIPAILIKVSLYDRWFPCWPLISESAFLWWRFFLGSIVIAFSTVVGRVFVTR